MGLTVVDLTPEARRAAGVAQGVLVIDVVPGGAADRKGIQEGDIITAYENEPVRSALELLARIRHDGPGFQAGVSISREGSERWIGFVELDAQPVPPPSGDVIEARFEKLEDDIADLEARVDSLERLPRPIPRHPVILH
jgi:C-terminal processing protease CtpA/Prc